MISWKIMLKHWNFTLRYQATKKRWVGYKQLIAARCSDTWICNILKIVKGVQLWSFSFQFRKLNPLRSGPFLKPDWELTFHAIQSSNKSLRLFQSYHSSYLLISGSVFLHVLIIKSSSNVTSDQASLYRTAWTAWKNLSSS